MAETAVAARIFDASPKAAIEGVGLVSADLHGVIARILTGFPVRIELSNSADLVVARIESACPPIILIDGDLLGCPVELCSLARSLRRGVIVLGLTDYWSERDDTLRGCVDVLLHKPPRQPEWRRIVGRLITDRMIGTERQLTSYDDVVGWRT